MSDELERELAEASGDYDGWVKVSATVVGDAELARLRAIEARARAVLADPASADEWEMARFILGESE